MGIHGHNAWIIVKPDLPKGFGKAEFLLFVHIDHLFHCCGIVNPGPPDTMQIDCLKLLARGKCPRSHTAFSDNHPYTECFNDLVLVYLIPDTRCRSAGNNTPFTIVIANNGTGMVDGAFL